MVMLIKMCRKKDERKKVERTQRERGWAREKGEPSPAHQEHLRETLVQEKSLLTSGLTAFAIYHSPSAV